MFAWITMKLLLIAVEFSCTDGAPVTVTEHKQFSPDPSCFLVTLLFLLTLLSLWYTFLYTVHSKKLRWLVEQESALIYSHLFIFVLFNVYCLDISGLENKSSVKVDFFSLSLPETVGQTQHPAYHCKMSIDIFLLHGTPTDAFSWVTKYWNNVTASPQAEQKLPTLVSYLHLKMSFWMSPLTTSWNPDALHGNKKQIRNSFNSHKNASTRSARALDAHKTVSTFWILTFLTLLFCPIFGKDHRTQ